MAPSVMSRAFVVGIRIIVNKTNIEVIVSTEALHLLNQAWMEGSCLFTLL